MIDVSPLYGLLLRTPRLELRLGDSEEVHALGALAQHGIHPAGEMPFSVPWTDGSDEPGFVAAFAAYHRERLAAWRPSEWHLNLLVWADGELVGTQEVYAVDFAVARQVATGSWLGVASQGRGIGTEMRAAVLEFGFAGLGATCAESAWLVGNHTSRRVSEKLGYVPVGTRTERPRGVDVIATVVRLDRENWHSPVPVEITGLDPARSLFGADQASERRATPSD